MRSLKILAVDDDPVTRMLIKKKLIKEDYEIEIAENGVKAIELINNTFFDVVLTDLMMPGGVDGIGVLEAVKKKSSQTEVILITGFASVENAIEAMKKGAADYLQKPINFDELFLRLHKIEDMMRLAKNAGDLREAMSVTEDNAGYTIQNLELKVGELQNQLYEIEDILLKFDLDPQDRIESALKTIGM